MSESKESAIREIEEAIAGSRRLQNSFKGSEEFVRWYMGTVRLLERIFGQISEIHRAFISIKFEATGGFIGDLQHINEQLELRAAEAFLGGLGAAAGILQAGIDEINREGIQAVYESKNTPQESSDLLKVLTLGERKLRKVMRTPPSSEKEVQDSYEDLLIGADIDYKREFPRISYSSKEYIPDFSFARIDLAVDIKICPKASREKEIIAEVNDDILAYRTEFGNLAFLIYDLGFIRDTDRFKDSFEECEGVVIQVVKH